MQEKNSPEVVIKRSVSPDGRIDSLSVEFGFPVENLSTTEIKHRAETAMKLQADITESFLKGNGNGKPAGNGAPPPAFGNGGDGSVPAEVLGIAGMPGKWGRRLFLNVRTDERTLRLFGNTRQLAECLESLGYPDYDGKIAEGLSLNLACRVITKLSEDGKWVNIDRILPARGNGR